MTPTSYDEAVAAWTSHLRAGGTMSWSEWVQQPSPPAPEAARHPLPDAVHLELLRRLNLAAGEPVQGLADRVLATASPGRGLVDVPLPWPGRPRGYGSPAIEPARLPEEELVRLAVGVVVHLLPAVPRPREASVPSSWPLPWRRRFRLHGSPGTVAAVRRGLLDQGLVETDWRPTHVVLARPVEVMMAELWAAGTHAGRIAKWSTHWRRAVGSGRLPPVIDVGRIAARLAGSAGRRREPVHVVVARDARDVAAGAARVLGARPFTVTGDGELAQSDLLRRVNRLTALTAGPDQVVDLGARLVAALEGVEPPRPTPPPEVPRQALSWAREQAAATARDLREAGYAVHGSPDDLVPPDRRQPGTVDRTRTLDLALAACLRTWRLQEGPS